MLRPITHLPVLVQAVIVLSGVACTHRPVNRLEAAPPLSPTSPAPLPLAQLGLQPNDLPPGAVITSSGPGRAPGEGVVASFDEHFQLPPGTALPHQVTPGPTLAADFLRQYQDTSSAMDGIRAISAQSLAQSLGLQSIQIEAATIPKIAEDASGYRFASTSNGVPVEGFLIVFHQGPVVVAILTAAVQGSELLPEAERLAQEQAERLRAVR